MAKVRASSPSTTSKRGRPAITPEARENQLISLAVDLAEQQLREGTASSQVITHYLKLGSMREKLEREKLEEENKLLRARTKAVENDEASKVRYELVIAALRDYNGLGNMGGQDDADECDY